jgi:hypothetical protein
MKSNTFALCLGLLAFAAIAAARDLKQDTRTSCLTDSTATLVLKGSGFGQASAKAFCEAEAKAKAQIEKVISEYIVGVFDNAKDQCTEAKAQEAVTGIAKAVASAYASVTTSVDIQGTGKACASGFAAGDAFAVSLVDIIVDLSVKLVEDTYPDKDYGKKIKTAVKDKKDSASGRAVGQAVAVVIASAWAAASDKACTTGGWEGGFEEAFVKSTSTAVAQLWATVVLELCSNFDAVDYDALKQWEEKTSKSFSEVTGDIDVENSTIAKSTKGGDASGESGEILSCSDMRVGKYQKKPVCCKAIYDGRKSCSCGTGCSMSEFSSAGLAGTRVWSDDASGELCFC